MYTAYITHPNCFKHDLGQDHPECPARLMAIEDQLIAFGIKHFLQERDAPLASFEQLARVHATDYIEYIHDIAPKEGMVYLDPDTAMTPTTLQAALRAAGSAVLATDLVIAGDVANAFCAIRPPGHHAESAKAMGFSFFNNVAVGAAHAIEHHGLKRVAIADFDVHQGNGTVEMFKDNPQVMVCSTYQHPFYPYHDVASNEHIINVPLPAGTDGAAFREAIRQHWLPALADFKPEMLFISAGFDAHREDDMAQFKLTEADYSWVTQQLKDIAEKYAQGRIVSVLEGGYELHALGRSAAAHIKVLTGL